MINRKITKRLERFFEDNGRYALLIDGARQVGKTWLMTEFADQHYPKDTVYVNFMDDNLLRDQFTNINIDARSVVETISLATGKSIEEGKTLLVLDEIQESPRAIFSIYDRLPFANFSRQSAKIATLTSSTGATTR